MKKIIALISILFAVSAAAFSQTIIPLQEDTSLYEENSKGEMIWSKYIMWGEPLLVGGDSQELVSKKAIRVSSTQKVERRFTLVNYEGKDYWVQSDRIATEGSLGVVTEEACLYLTKTSPKASRFLIPKGSVIAYKESTEKDALDFLTEIWWLEGTESYTVKHGYVLTSKLSKNSADVTGVQMLKTSKTITKIDARKKYLEDAAEKCVSESVKNMLLNEAGSSSATNLNNVYTEKFEGEISGVYRVEFTDPELKVFIYEKPNAQSQIINELDNSETYTVAVVARSKELQTVDGKKNHWYQISNVMTAVSQESCSGWIFGSSLSSMGFAFESGESEDEKTPFELGWDDF